VLIGGLVAVVVVLGVIAAVLMARRTHDDQHSVEHYHRQLHTLEEIRAHPAGDNANVRDGHMGAFPASAFRVSGSSTVRLTETGESPVPPVPPVPPPPVPNPSEPLSFDDAGLEPVPATFMTGNEDRVIHSINHRPRRLGGPAAAVAAVLVLVLVLILTGLHSDNSKHHGATSTPATTHPADTHHHRATSTTTTTTTAPPPVSAATAATAHTATYTVTEGDYSLSIGATSGECWVEVSNTATGGVLFTTTLLSGQSHVIAATGPVTVIAGAPGAFTATVNGSPVALPPGNQAPFTLHFQTAGSSTTTAG